MALKTKNMWQTMWIVQQSDLQNQFDVVIDAQKPQGLHLAAFKTRPLGKLVLKSTCAVGSNFNTAPFVIDEINVIGSRCGPFPEAIDLLNNHQYHWR